MYMSAGAVADNTASEPRSERVAVFIVRTTMEGCTHCSQIAALEGLSAARLPRCFEPVDRSAAVECGDAAAGREEFPIVGVRLRQLEPPNRDALLGYGDDRAPIEEIGHPPVVRGSVGRVNRRRQRGHPLGLADGAEKR